MSDDPKDAAQAALDSCGIEAGQIWRHYKGGLYVVTAVAIDEATLTPLVVYRSNRKGTTWVRTLANFTELVDTDVEYMLPDGSRRMGKHRFYRERN